MGGNVFIVSAPSGAGKTSLVNALVKQVPEAGLSISHTTRAPRPGEVDGRHYHFVSAAAFEAMVAEDAFIEHAEVFGNYYGTSRAAVDALIDADREVILEIDWQGAQQIKRAIPEALGIFILPPSLATLRERLEGRRQDSAEVITRRLAEARAEMAHYAAFDYLVVNEDFQRALDDLMAIVRTARLRTAPQRARLEALLGNLV